MKYRCLFNWRKCKNFNFFQRSIGESISVSLDNTKWAKRFLHKVGLNKIAWRCCKSQKGRNKISKSNVIFITNYSEFIIKLLQFCVIPYLIVNKKKLMKFLKRLSLQKSIDQYWTWLTLYIKYCHFAQIYDFFDEISSKIDLTHLNFVNIKKSIVRWFSQNGRTGLILLNKVRVQVESFFHQKLQKQNRKKCYLTYRP